MAPSESKPRDETSLAETGRQKPGEARAELFGNRDADEELVCRSRNGETAAFDQLVLRYQDRIFNLLARMSPTPEDAEDLAQETFLQALRALPSFKQGSKFYTWLFRIAVNKGLSQRRQDARRRRHEGGRLDAALSSSEEDGQSLGAVVPERQESDPARQFDRELARQQVRRQLGEIEPDYRAILVLREIEGMDYDAIADTLSISKAAVKSRLHRARLEMARLLKDLQEKN